MSKIYRILVVNPGSTSSKLGLFENEKMMAEKKITHSAEEIAQYPRIMDQIGFRRQAMDEFLQEQGLSPKDLSAVVGRGGILKPIPSGTYSVCSTMLEDIKNITYGEHASNMGAVLADSFTKDYGIPAFIVDPTTVDELKPVAKYSGIKEITRCATWHALNVMAVVRQVCEKENLVRENVNFVVAHIGGGISISAIEKGRCVDVSNGIHEGPFTPERAGSLPTGTLVKLCFSGQYTFDEINKLLVGRGGLVNYIGTSDLMEVENRVNSGDIKTIEVLEAMCYQISKTIGSMVAVLKGDVTKIILTGGGARCTPLVEEVSKYVKSFAPVYLVPGENELASMNMGGLRVLQNQISALNYAAQ